MNKYLLVFLLLLKYLTVTGADTIIIDSIVIKGNDLTKRNVITRELTFQAGDTIESSLISALIATNRIRLVNTNLFSVVTLTLQNGVDIHHTFIEINLIEKWYIFPGPIFSYGDRNLYTWLHDYGGKLDRVNYGLRLSHFNLTGRRDPLTLTLQAGYTPKIALGYSLPFFDKKQHWGFFSSVFYAKNHEIGYITQNNTVPNLTDSIGTILRTYGADLGFSYRPALFDTHFFSAGYYVSDVDPIVVQEKNNPNYFGDKKTQQKFTWIAYAYQHDTRDLAPYPSKGHNFAASIALSGLLSSDDVHNLSASVRYSHYFPITDKWSSAHAVRIKVDLLRDNQPYNFNHAFGYGGDILHGYDAYVVDGLDFFYLKNSLRYEFFHTDLRLNKVPIIRNKIWKGFWDVPLRCYLTANFDAGYANLPDTQAYLNNTFSNKMLYGYGVGLDIVIYHNIVIQLDYSFNDTGKGGFYYRQRSSF